jgi:putative flippase GtrA
MISSRFSRFIISGGLNTVMTYALYLGLLQLLPYHVSYTLAYISGIGLAYALNRFFVFEGHRGLQSVVALPLIYVAQYFLGIVLIWVCVEKIGVSDVVAPLLVIMLSVPFTYFLSHLAFLGNKKPSRPLQK